MAESKQPEVVEHSHAGDLNGLTSRPLQLDELPVGYYRSKNFIGSVVGVCLMAISLYLGFVLPVCRSKCVLLAQYKAEICLLGEHSRYHQ